jgi:hypothetical protein
MPTNRLYDAWIAWLKQRLPHERITRLRTAASVLAGLFLSRSVHLSEVAAEIPGGAKLLSQQRRISRWLDNPAITPKRWYAPVARWWLGWAARTQGEIVLIVDGSRVSTHHQLLMVALALPGRALPLAWSWVDGAHGHSSRPKQLALLARVRTLVPAAVRVTLVGDCEFGAVALMQQVAQVWQWEYVLRQKSNNQVCLTPGVAPALRIWQDFERLVIQSGSLCFVRQGLLTQKYAFATALLAVWERGEKECWLLATSLPSADATLRYYRQRMRIEEMFGDFKRHGFDLEHTRLRHIHRLGRLVLLVCLLYVWLLRTGLMLLIARTAHLVDRHERRDLSLFQLGLRYIKRLLINAQLLRVWLCPDNLYDRWPADQCKLSGN